jgi:hypothetical protein
MDFLRTTVITALEIYLSGAFNSFIHSDRKLFRKFVETTPDFQSEKIPLSNIFRATDEIDQKAKTYLSEFVWHRLDRVKPMFRDTLGVEFPPDMKELFQAVVLRHDLVHRNGKSKDGKAHVLDEDQISKLAEMTEGFVAQIVFQLQRHGLSPPSGAPHELLARVHSERADTQRLSHRPAGRNFHLIADVAVTLADGDG